MAPFFFSDPFASRRKVGRVLSANASNSSRTSVLEWVQTALLVANVVVTTLQLGGSRAETALVAGMLTAAALTVHFVACAWHGRDLRAVHPLGVGLLLFLAYGAINVVYVSPVPWLGWLDWLGWANASAVFWVAANGVRSARPRRVLFTSLVLLAVVAVAMGAYQRFAHAGWMPWGERQPEQFVGRASGPFGIPNSLAGFLLLLLPAAAALTLRRGVSATARVWWGWVTALLAFGLLLTLSRGAWISLALAVIVWPLTVAQWRWGRRVTVAASVMAGIAAVGAIVYQLSPGARDRLDRLAHDSGELSRPILWRAAANLFRAQPLTGTGAGSYNVLFERHRPRGFLDEPEWAHNEYLNTLSDYGLIGVALLGAAALAGALRRPPGGPHPAPGDRPGSRTLRRAFAIGLLAFAGQMGIDFHLKIPALATAFAIVLALALRSGPRVPDASPRRSTGARGLWLVAAAAVAIAARPMTRLYRAEALRAGARQALDDYARRPERDVPGRFTDAERSLRRAVELAPRHAAAWSDLAFALQMQARVDPARIRDLAGPAEEAARKALRVTTVVPEFWIRLAVSLDMQSHTPEARRALEQALQLAPHHAHAWYYYAYHLSLATEQREAALRAIANCLSLDPGNRAAEALRAKLNARSLDAHIVP